MATFTEPTIYNEVFISYSRKNEVFARKIVKAIYDSGRENIWIDWEDIEYAEDWWQKIQAGIDSADNFIFILTPGSAQSKVCYDEVDYAVKSGKRIIPIEHIAITEQADFEKMHPNVSAHNWLPFKEGDDFDEGMKQLVKTLETDLKHVKLHTRFLVRARDWEIGDRDASFLLTGAEIDSAETWLAEADFWIDQYEVTNEQFEAFSGVAVDSPLYWHDPKQPRTAVTWFEAQAFCELRGGSLPTEARWEYAARGVNNLIYPWGNEYVEDYVAYGEAAIVGDYHENESWVGAYDMSGNVWEWTSSIGTAYPYDADDGRENLDDVSSGRVLRGGSFVANSTYLRSSHRDYRGPRLWDNHIGFRCVMSVPVP